LLLAPVMRFFLVVRLLIDWVFIFRLETTGAQRTRGFFIYYAVISKANFRIFEPIGPFKHN
jgi:hypothetical protein